MPECDYCGESFGSEGAYLDHLAADHEGELGPIDRRRVQDRSGGGSGIIAGLSAGPIALVLVLVLAGGAVAYVTFGVGGGNGGEPGEPYDYGAVHEHGTINVTIDGQTLDFSQPQYQYQNTQDRAFHFEAGNGQMWHVHARGVTVAYAMNTLGINVTQNSVTFNGTTYRNDDPEWEVIVEVNGESVNPQEYVLEGAGEGNFQQGDHIRILVRSA